MRRLIALSLLIIFVLPGCGADITPTKANDFSPLTQIIISSENPFIANKTSNLFTAEGNFSDLFTRDITTEVVWTSSNPEFATIESNGKATAVAPGTTQITATMNDVVDYFILTVTAATISSLEISPIAPSVPKGLTEQFSATGTFSDATVQSLTNSVTWSSVNTTVAIIDQTGMVAALEEGTTNITAAFDGETKTTQLTVAPAKLLFIDITPDIADVPQQWNVNYIAQGIYTDGTRPTITDLVEWSSSAQDIATINANGVAYGSSAGTALITATLNSVSSSSTLNISESKLVEINITPSNPSVDQNATINLIANGILDNLDQFIITEVVTWSTTDNDVTATVSNISGEKGLTTGINTGSTTVTATSGSIVGTTILTVN